MRYGGGFFEKELIKGDMNTKPKTEESKQFLKDLSDLLTNHNAEIICEGDEIYFHVANEKFIGNC